MTGQAAWFDLRVRIAKATSPDALSHPQFAPFPHTPVDDRPLRYGASFRAARAEADTGHDRAARDHGEPA